jgi:hypothetical protein
MLSEAVALLEAPGHRDRDGCPEDEKVGMRWQTSDPDHRGRASQDSKRELAERNAGGQLLSHAKSLAVDPLKTHLLWNTCCMMSSPTSHQLRACPHHP